MTKDEGEVMRYMCITVVSIACILAPQALGEQPSLSAPPPAKPPNIVFILADDYAMNLVQYMLKSKYQGLQSMMTDGTTFSNFYVGDSLCCPSRSTIFTGQYPHNTGVFTNTWKPSQGLTDGGFQAFNANKDQFRTFALALSKVKPHAYTTAMMGKYLNDYLPWATEPYNAKKLWNTEWGWSEWDVAGNGYPEFIYDLNENGTVVHEGINPENYMTDVLDGLALDFIKRAQEPFFLEVATFAPHAPYRPAYRDETAFAGAVVPRTPAYDARPDAAAPDWVKDVPALEQQEKDSMDDEFRLRTQCLLAIDKLISDVRSTLKDLGRDKDTYIFFSADNGYHMGEYSFLSGKETPYDTDIEVPLVVVGPGVQNQTVSQIAQMVDLAPTFAEIGGAGSPLNADGKSLVPLLGKTPPPEWRQIALIEHHGPPDDPDDPDIEKHEKSSGDAKPPNYEALRSSTYMYVEYSNTGKITSCTVNSSGDATFMVNNSGNFIVTKPSPTLVTITGITSPASLNVTNQPVTAATPTSFTIHGAFPPGPCTIKPQWSAIVTAGKDGVSEYAYYNLDKGSATYDQYELKNIFGSLPASRKTSLHDAVVKNKTCGPGTTKPTCWSEQLTAP